ncbi:MAG: response regulator [Anaerolineales bacterium]|jgi:DNA-binding response OmpR family regulator
MARVLLIEDDPTMLSLLNTLLEIEGYEVVQLENFDNVLESVRSISPDVILMDVHLEDIDGLSILESIRKENVFEGIKVIMSSGMDFNDESLLKGANGFLLKPYMPDELIKLINHLLEL